MAGPCSLSQPRGGGGGQLTSLALLPTRSPILFPFFLLWGRRPDQGPDLPLVEAEYDNIFISKQACSMTHLLVKLLFSGLSCLCGLPTAALWVYLAGFFQTTFHRPTRPNPH